LDGYLAILKLYEYSHFEYSKYLAIEFCGKSLLDQDKFVHGFLYCFLLMAIIAISHQGLVIKCIHSYSLVTVSFTVTSSLKTSLQTRYQLLSCVVNIECPKNNTRDETEMSGQKDPEL